MTEFDIIKKFFTPSSVNRKDVILGTGDDSALVVAPNKHHIAITTDTLIEGLHFPSSTPPEDIGYKALAVNLSDLAAMGATPAWVTMALTLPDVNESWLTKFSEGFFALANKWDVQLIGGDLTRGRLSITITAHGFIPEKKALRRHGAKPNDWIYVSNTIGDAAYALSLIKNEKHVPAILRDRLNRPEPQIALGKKLLNIATAAIDISDGLAADLQHILDASLVGATLYVDRIPLSPFLQTLSFEEASTFALNGGDDYELCFTAPPNTDIPFTTHIGEITSTPGLRLISQNGELYRGSQQGFRHF